MESQHNNPELELLVMTFCGVGIKTLYYAWKVERQSLISIFM